MKSFVDAIFEITKYYFTFQSEINTKINQKESVILYVIHSA